MRGAFRVKSSRAPPLAFAAVTEESGSAAAAAAAGPGDHRGRRARGGGVEREARADAERMAEPPMPRSTRAARGRGAARPARARSSSASWPSWPTRYAPSIAALAEEARRAAERRRPPPSRCPARRTSRRTSTRRPRRARRGRRRVIARGRGAASPTPEPAGSGPNEGARLLALNMALSGTPRDETARYLTRTSSSTTWTRCSTRSTPAQADRSTAPIRLRPTRRSGKRTRVRSDPALDSMRSCPPVARSSSRAPASTTSRTSTSGCRATP